MKNIFWFLAALGWLILDFKKELAIIAIVAIIVFTFFFGLYL